MCASDIFLGLIAILFPPLPVWVKTGICSADSIINILLCMLGGIPGIVHAWYIIAKYPETFSYYEEVPQDPERNARVTYVYVQGGPGPVGRQQRGIVKQSATVPSTGYGTTAPVAPPAQQQDGTWAGGAGEGSSNGMAPPPYEQAVGDHKIQTRD